MKDVENESTKCYRQRSQQEAVANAVADMCLSDVNVEASEAIQEIDGILRSCYMTGKYVTPEHEWYSDKPVVITSTVTVPSSTTQSSTTTSTSTTQESTTTERTSTTQESTTASTSTNQNSTTSSPPTTQDSTTSSPPIAFPSSDPASENLIIPVKEIDPIANQIAGKISQNVGGWFTNAKNKLMSLIR